MNPERQFCTLFDRNYLLKGVVMLDTLHRHCPEAVVHVLCMDQPTFDILNALDLPGVRPLQLAEVETEDLLAAKSDRSIAEYCWTLTPALCWYLLHARPDVQLLTYVDADLMFFSEVAPLFAEARQAAIIVTEHRFAPHLAHLEAYGRFNVQWVSFRRSEPGIACLQEWRRQCIDWCFARLEDGRLGDQKYLDEWPVRFGEAVHIIQHPGAGVAPWNFSRHTFAERDGVLYVDAVPLVFYHFHQFQLLRGARYDYMSSVYSQRHQIPTAVYARYVEEIEAVLVRVRTVAPGFDGGIRPAFGVLARRTLQKLVPVRVKNVLRRWGVQTW